MPHRPTVEFLRRRYAAAILCDDADTAGRLRAQLDGIMNPAGSSGRGGDAAPAQAPLSDARHAQASPARPQAAEPSSAQGQLAPRLRLVTPVTGLLDGPRGAGDRVARSG
jgi:hypothetical protein